MIWLLHDQQCDFASLMSNAVCEQELINGGRTQACAGHK